MESPWLLPINTPSRKSFNGVQRTSIGEFGVMRKARKGIPAHFHTGIDLKRPSGNYVNEPIFPASNGVIVSLRDDGPFSQIIIEHTAIDGKKVWTVYEHLVPSGSVLGRHVSPADTIGRFFSREELQRYGWQFDHLHFEIMKVPPPVTRYREELPQYRFSTYALVCYTREILEERMIDPIIFFDSVGALH